MNKQNWIIGGFIAIFLIAGAFALSFFRDSRADGGRLKGKEVVAEPQEPVFGAIPGNVVSSNFFEIGGIEGYYERQSILATSSVLCSIQNKLSATSTIESAAAQITRGVFTSGTQYNTLDVSTTTAAFRFGSSTPALIYAKPLRSLASTTISWQPNGATTTPDRFSNNDSSLRGVLPSIRDDGSSNILIGPYQYLTFRIATGTPGTLAEPFLGTCSAVFHKI